MLDQDVRDMLEACDVTISYDRETRILDSISLQLRLGEMVLLTGPTGSGKSTLAKYLAGIIPRLNKGLINGSLKIDGQDTSEWPLPRLSKSVGLVQQDPENQICTLKVLDEVAFGPENYEEPPLEVLQNVNSCLARVGATHLRERSTLAISGGEKQRVVIASVLACRPKYLILDEPTSNLDPRGIQLLRQILMELKRDMGILCIEHEVDALRSISDRVLRLEDGHIQPVDMNTYKEKRVAGASRRPVYETHHDREMERPLVSLREVSFSYDGVRALHDVTIDVYRGNMIALMGDNGAGKTTMLEVLGGLISPENGTAFLDSIDMRRLDYRQIARRIAFVFQNPNNQIFEKTVWREQTLVYRVCGTLDSQAIASCEDALVRAGLDHLKDRNPFSLSHGQKKRLNISSVTSHRPDLYLLDEPFIGQDSQGREYVLDTARSVVQRGGAAVIVTHDIPFALANCDRAVFLEQGTILMDGDPVSVVRRLKELGYHEYVPEGE